MVLGGTGRTGSRIARALVDQGVPTRTASRAGSEARFDWDDPATYATVLDGVDRVYLVPPTVRVRFADRVAAFLDIADGAGVRHVTLLSAYGADRAPSVIDLAETERLVTDQDCITHTVLRPSWVVQNFTDEHLPLVDDALLAPMLRWLTGTVIDGHGAAPTADVERVLGRPATDFTTFARGNTAAWTR